jgi:hypothetical protein
LFPPKEEVAGLALDPGCVVEKIPPPNILPEVEELDGLSGVAPVVGLEGKLKRPLPTAGAVVEAAFLLVATLG